MVDIDTCSPHCTCKFCLDEEKERDARSPKKAEPVRIPRGFEPSTEDDIAPVSLPDDETL